MSHSHEISLPAFTLRQLAYFVAAADAGTIAAAAARLRVSPSAMSDAITELETALNEQLCVRRRAHGLSLTPAGQRLLVTARQVLADLDDLNRSLDGSGKLSGPIVLGCYPTLAPMILPPLLQDFALAHPKIELIIKEAAQDQLADDLRLGRIDLAFVYDMLVPAETGRTQLFALSAQVLLPAAHPLAARESLELREIVSEDLILFDVQPSGEHGLSLFAAQGLQPRVRHRTSNLEVVRTLVARGLGYAVVVSPVANPHSYEGLPVVAKTITPPVSPVGVEAIWSLHRPLPARTRALIKFARAAPWLS